MTQKNVVLLVLDSLRKDKLSVYNDEVDFTENIQELSEEATVFENAVANASWTLPSHASFFSGMYPWDHGATQTNLFLDVEKPLLAERLSDEGYRSAAFSTNAWLSGKFGLTSGFDTVDNLSSTGFSETLTKIRRHLDEWLASDGQERVKRYLVRVGNYLFHYRNGGSKTEDIFEKGREFIEGDDDPFFLFMNLMDAHEPYFPPEKYRKKHDVPNPDEVCQDPTDFHFDRMDPNFEGLHKIYDASVDYMDDHIGEFFEYLKDEGLWEETVVVVISDHGQMLGDNDEYGHQFSVADGLIDVPMIIKDDDKENVSGQVELKELYRVLLNALELEESADFESKYALGGYDFPDMMRPRIPPNKWEKFYQRHVFARSEDGKLVVSETESGEKTESFDPKDLKDSVKKNLRGKIENISYENNDGKGLEEQEEEIKKQLENLGYGQK